MTTRQLLLDTWHFNPVAAAGVALMIVGYIFLQRLRPNSHGDSVAGTQGRGGIVWRTAALALLVVALVSPLDTLADGYLFSAHMLQHLVLLLIVPALLLLSFPGALRPTVQTAPPNNARKQHWTARALAAWMGGVGAMWIWHAPTLCDLAARSVSIRTLQMISLLSLGTFFWWPIMGAAPAGRISPLASVLYLFTACVGCTVLGIAITFAPVSVCHAYLHPVDRLGLLPLIRGQWGLSPQADQQIGGLLMWVPACLIYLSGIMAILLQWQSGADLVTGKTSAGTQPAHSA